LSCSRVLNIYIILTSPSFDSSFSILAVIRPIPGAFFFFFFLV
jgi:hypothetical protein